MSETSKKKMLICGATGFIGRNLTEYFSKQDKYDIVAVYHNKPPFGQMKNVSWVHADLNNAADVKRVMSGVSVVLQFAATTSGSKDITSRPYIHVTDNAVMNSLLLRECYESNIEHFVFPSCTVMYQPSSTALSECDFSASDEILPKYFGVGNTKVYIEDMCKFYSRFKKTKHTVLRHSNIYGPHDKYDLERSHVFGATVTKVMTSEDKLVVWGDGEEGRDLLHVDDMVDFVNLALEKQNTFYELYNVGCGYATKIKDLVKQITRLSGKTLEIEHDLTKPTIKTTVFLDCSKAKNELGWSPKVSLESGIETTLEWYRENVLAGDK